MNNTSAERPTHTVGVVSHAFRYPRVLSIASSGGPLNHGHAPEAMRLQPLN
ncbi:hypothetical protein SAMN05444679_12630 [Variovorax sp. CF079]|uniref:hypothetical protein n=1 Tax=Variovorax sp. CF079 TaxID=1882774 RepID=UPI00088AEA33|nr:hypothetical protein [Variovorax sp. CF079]SDE61351.1 hypothetical protein SAMN05444679_12630 [Variovorax sp. CF079]